jgi:uracil-DNA glycosylase
VRRDRVVLLGQAPSRDGDPLRPLIGGGSGRILQLLTGTMVSQYRELYERRNLLKSWPGAADGKGDHFPTAEAHAAAVALLPRLAGRRVVLLGSGVARAFGFDTLTPRFCWIERDGVRFALSPHPSPVNRWWNEYRNRAQAARFFGSITTGGPELPLSSGQPENLMIG